MPVVLALICSFLMVLLAPARADDSDHEEDLSQVSLGQLESRLAEIDKDLSQLAKLTLRTGLGGVGYRSATHREHDVPEQVRIHLESEYLIDQVVLVPILLRGREDGVFADGFPLAFDLIAGTQDRESIIASFSSAQHRASQTAPLVLDFPPVMASWVELRVTSMSKTASSRPDDFDFQLSEIFVFSGPKAVSINKQVTATSRRHHGWGGELLTDGFTPYLMDSGLGSGSPTEFIFFKEEAGLLTLIIDLEASYDVSQINLHSAEMIISIPQGIANNTGVPRHVTVSGANSTDFSDETILCEVHQTNLKSLGPIIRKSFKEIHSRYIILRVIDARPYGSPGKVDRAAFSEIEVLCDGRNVARGKSVSARIGPDSLFQNVLPKLADGANYYGEILSLRSWMDQLAQRQALETERPLLINQLRTQTLLQQGQFRIASRVGGGLLCIILFASFIFYRINRNKVAVFRERVTADLHDELGANLHSISLFCELAEASKEDPAVSMDYVKRIRATTTRSNKAVHQMTKLDESSSLFGELESDMRRAANRIIVNIKHSFHCSGKDHFHHFSLRTRVDLLLFYKECLINTLRHSGATEVTTELSATPLKIRLVVLDNGLGLSNENLEMIPPSLARRARLLKAQLDSTNLPEGGIKITLEVGNRKTRFPWRLLNFSKPSQGRAGYGSQGQL